MQDDILNRNKEAGLFVPWVFPTVSAASVPMESEIEIKIGEQQSNDELEIIKLKQDLQCQIDLLEDINTKFLRVVSEIDKDLLQQIVSLVKKITQKVIGKQIELDSRAMVTMIESALKQIEKKQKYEIFLSSEDYQQLEHVNSDSLNTFLQIDSALKPGDFRIAMPTGEITAIMEERLNTFFGL